jgi:hypothetical protein
MEQAQPGITIGFDRFPENADFSIRSDREPFANATETSDLHLAKLSLSRTATDDGISIDFNPLV